MPAVGGHPEETATAPTTAAPPTATPTTAALGEQVTTVEAAQRLLDLFARLDGDAARLLLQKGAPDAEFDQALQAVYVGQALGTVREVFDREAKLGFFGYARPQPDPTYRASRIIDARRNDCVVLAGTLDVRARYTNPLPADQRDLRPRGADGDLPERGQSDAVADPRRRPT